MAKPTKAEAQLAEVKTSLAQFMKNNSDARLLQAGKRKKFHLIMRPWDDPSVAFLVPDDEPERDEFAAAVNALILPARLSAIYHTDEKQLEIIFTARKLSEALRKLNGRKFDFHFRDQIFQCVFERSSERLLKLASRAIYPENSDTAFRNLQSFTQYQALKSEPDSKDANAQLEGQFAEPLSFYVRSVDWKGEETIEILRHVAFYLTYYDSKSPYIVIHPPRDTSAIKPKVRYIHGDFPGTISSRELNPSLLSFWYAGLDADPDRKFLYYYRIIEFVASNYLKNEKLREVRRILSAPDLASRLDSSVDALVGLIREEKPDTVNRFKAVVLELADKAAVWQEISANPKAFTEDVQFDGGFKLPRLLDDITDVSKLTTTVITTMAGHLRDVRNALAHGGEAQAGRLILPTAKNLRKLQPWVHLMTTIAGQVVLFEHHT